MSTKLQDRPARSYLTGKVTRVLRVLTLIGVGMTSVYVILTYNSLPERVPTHFGFTGEADAWGPKSSIWLLLGINIVMVVGLALLSRRPRWFNYPANITEENAQRMYREGERMLVWLNLVLLLVFIGALQSIYGVDSPWLVVGLILMPVVTITGVVRISMASDAKTKNGLDSTGFTQSDL